MQKPAVEKPQGFILPNLCADQPLLLLLMAAQLVVIAFILFEYGFQFDWIYFGQVTLYVQWQVILSVLVICRLRTKFATMPQYQAASLAYVILLLIALTVAVSVHLLAGQFNIASIFRNVLLSAIISGLALRYLYIQQQSIEREKSILQASLTALQAKMRPHFLFNTMNSIASLISFEPEKAEKMVEDLSELLRASLRDSQTETTLAEEWRLCERYLAIEQVRLGDRLDWRCDFGSMDMQTSIPSFSLQPLIENAIYHGIQPNKDKGFIHISAKQHDEMVHILVQNSYSKHAHQKQHRGNRMAVDNIRLRVLKLYGASAGLDLLEKEGVFEAHLYYKKKNKQDEL
jgi:two-component system, LytTR family, sensor histidine kinase AlgZ